MAVLLLGCTSERFRIPALVGREECSIFALACLVPSQWHKSECARRTPDHEQCSSTRTKIDVSRRQLYRRLDTKIGREGSSHTGHLYLTRSVLRRLVSHFTVDVCHGQGWWSSVCQALPRIVHVNFPEQSTSQLRFLRRKLPSGAVAVCKIP